MRSKRPPARLPIFRSAEQARLLSLLYLNPPRRWTLAELGGDRVSRATIERELAVLVEAGLVNVDAAGRTRLFSAATGSPLYRPLKDLLERSLGVEPNLRSALSGVEGIEAAAIFGSWAAGSSAAGSDIDVLVVGETDHSAVAEATMPLAGKIGREINVVTLAPSELQARLRGGDRFVAGVLGGKLVPLIGDIRAAADGG